MSQEQRTKRFVVCVVLPIAVASFLAAHLAGASAQDVKPRNAKAETSGNSDPAARIVAEGTSRGAIACARCHGYDGASDGSGAFPAIVGQPALYLSSQLQQYASGKRQNAIMQSIAKGLTPEEIESVAQYYATMRASVVPRRPSSPQQVALGQKLALQGDSEARVQACVTCHGPDGAGLPPSIPYLAGQYQHYTKVQIQMFRMGYRTSPPMQNVAHAMPDQHLDAIAAYFDQLPLPSHK